MRGRHEAIAALAVQALDLALVAVDGRRRIHLANPACEDLLLTHAALVRRNGRLYGGSAEDEGALAHMLDQLARRPAAVGRVAGLFTIGVALGKRNPLFLLLLVDTRRRLGCRAEDIATLFGLSPAEARLAYALASGQTLEQHAAAANVALSTVRTQLRYVLKKSSLRRQSELVRVIARFPQYVFHK